MTQQYNPVTWQDETTSQQGTLINAERLNQMQTAHHFADGFEEVDAVPTANPGVQYHKIVYCTADSTFYRWDGTEWTKDIDDETKQLLEQEIARATEAEGELAQDLADETSARETADTAMQADISALQSGKLDKQTAGLNQTQVYAVRGSTQRMLTAGASSGDIPLYNIEHTLFAKMPSAFDPTADTVVNYGWATAQIGAEATARAEADTLLGDRITAETSAREGADTALGNRITAEETRATQAEQANAQAIANTYTKGETDTLLASKADSTALATKVDTLSTAGLHAYTHNGATQSEVAVIDGTTASTIPIRDANGRLQAADPASGATDKSLVTANWVSQTGAGRPNNLLHDNGNENFSGAKNGTIAFTVASILSGSLDPNQDYYKWFKVGKIQPGRYARLTYNISFPYNNNRYMIMDAVIITARTQNISMCSLIKMSQVANIINPEDKYLAMAFDGTDINLYIKTGQFTHQTLYATAATSGGEIINASDIITPITPTLEDPDTQQFYLEI